MTLSTDPHAEHANAIFEGIGKLYHARYGRLRPGKDDRLRDSMSDDNVRQFSQWIKYDALDDAVMRIEELERLIEGHESFARSVSEALNSRSGRPMIATAFGDCRRIAEEALRGADETTERQAVRQLTEEAQERGEYQVADGFGNIWNYCARGKDCRLEVVRPGKVQCDCWEEAAENGSEQHG